MAYTIKNPKQYSKNLFKLEKKYTQKRGFPDFEGEGKADSLKGNVLASTGGGVGAGGAYALGATGASSLLVSPAVFVGYYGNKRYTITKNTDMVKTYKSGYTIVNNSYGDYDVIFPYGKHFYLAGKNLGSKKLAEEFIENKLPAKPSPFKTFAGSATGRSFAFQQEKRNAERAKAKTKLEEGYKKL